MLNSRELNVILETVNKTKRSFKRHVNFSLFVQLEKRQINRAIIADVLAALSAVSDSSLPVGNDCHLAAANVILCGPGRPLSICESHSIRSLAAASTNQTTSERPVGASIISPAEHAQPTVTPMSNNTSAIVTTVADPPHHHPKYRLKIN